MPLTYPGHFPEIRCLTFLRHKYIYNEDFALQIYFLCYAKNREIYMKQPNRKFIFIGDLSEPSFGSPLKYSILTESEILLRDPSIRVEYLESLKDQPITIKQYKKMTLGAQPVDLYDEVKHLIKYMWKASNKGELAIYKIKDNNECLSAYSSKEGFTNSIKAEASLFKELQETYESSIYVSQYKKACCY